MPLDTCPYASDCALADNIGMEAALRVWESFYCQGASVRCERYRLHLSGQEVPVRLLPNGRLLDLPGPSSPVTSLRSARHLAFAAGPEAALDSPDPFRASRVPPT
jgi:hypothetical protein